MSSFSVTDISSTSSVVSFDSIRSLGDNPYFGAGAGLFGIGVLAAFARKGGHYAQLLARRHFLTSVEVNSKDHCYHWLLKWLGDKAHNKNHTSVNTIFQQGDSGKISTSFIYGPSPGTHLVWFKGWPLWIERTRETQSRDFSTGMPFESMTLTTIAGRSNLYSNILREARETALKSHEGRTKIYVARASDWCEFGSPRLKRPIESVAFRKGLKEEIVDDVHSFLSSPEWYQSRGIPYRRGYLLHGPPGCGKSSFIFSLAGSIDYSISILNLSQQLFTDDRLSHLLVHAPHDSIVLLEDIDCIFNKLESLNNHSSSGQVAGYSPGGLSMSGLLNALDGVGSGVGRLVFMTTNHPQVLDPALVRPGRVDKSIHIGYLDSTQAENLFVNFYPACEKKVRDEFVHTFKQFDHGSISPAMLQSHFMNYKDLPDSAIEHFQTSFAKSL